MLVCLSVTLFSGAEPVAAPPTTAPPPDPTRFSDEISRFIEWDRRNAFPKHAILFVGSSSIRMWATRESFPDWPVINRGFGGSHTSDVNHYFNNLVKPYNAKVILLYAGDNDIASNRSPEQVRDAFLAFVGRVRETQPDVPILYLSIKPSASRWQHWPRMREANALIRDVCEKQPHLTYVDVGTPMLGSDGNPRPEYYLPDRLHLSEAGYAVWTRILTPILDEILHPLVKPPATGGTR
jgi:lysophospholipase L1-like esterase